jgi:hypothetical protein
VTFGPRSRADEDPRQRIARLYRWYAEVEAPDRSPLFAQVAAAVADDPGTLDFLAAMPLAKQQPNLLIGAVRYLYGTPPDAAGFLDLVRAHPDELAAVMAVRSTQTNEPARCATLLPALARLPQPLALLEVGASAGLCLLPDRYAFDYGRRRITPRSATSATSATPRAATPRVDPATPRAATPRVDPATPPTFPCRVDSATPLPEHHIEVVWRAGLDLHPVDLHDEAEVRWLEALVWPGQQDRLERLRAACDVARADPPRVVAGDLRSDLPALAAQAPAGATLVVFHTAVLAYLPDAGDRVAFARTVADLGAVWIANERPRVIPGISDAALEPPFATAFLLSVDGVPTAWTDPHGASISWFEGA